MARRVRSSDPAVGELVPQAHGGALRRGNPGNKGRPPSWIREQLREGLAKALPKLHEALDTGKDPRTGKKLSWADYTKTVEVVSRISMPTMSQVDLAGDGLAPFRVEVCGAPRDDEMEVIEQPPTPRAQCSTATTSFPSETWRKVWPSSRLSRAARGERMGRGRAFRGAARVQTALVHTWRVRGIQR